MRRETRVFFISSMTALSLVAVVSGCGNSAQLSNTSNGTGAKSGAKSITIWDIATGKQQQLIKDVTSQFDSKHSAVNAKVQFFQNNPYKQKIKIAMGAGNPPDIFFGWGGGTLKSYVNAGDVHDLTSAFNADPSWKNKFLPSVMKGATFNGKVYGVPNDNVQPVLFLYNKPLFQKYHLSQPKTWNDLLNDVKVFKSHNIAPISLAGKSKWPDLMYEEYLVDRIGGPKAFNAVIQGKSNAWSNPAFIKANTMIQKLVNAGAFEKGFASVGYSSGQADALVYTNKAAMQLMGDWDFGSILSSDPKFIQNNNLGWFAFPKVAGGKGNPSDIAGNLANYYSISQASKNKQASLTYLKDAVLDKTAVTKYIGIGDVPPVKGIQSQLKQAKHGQWLLFNYNLVKNAPNFQMSWDQALPPKEAQALLTNLDKLFLKQITPQQFSSTMNKYIK